MFILRHLFRPVAPVFIPPGMISEECHFTRAVSVPEDIIEVEILNVVGTDSGLRFLFGPVSIAGLIGYQFRGYVGIQDGLKNMAGIVVKLICFDDPANKVLNQCF